MRKAIGGPAIGGLRERRGATALVIGNLLSLAATPAFVLMGWLTASSSGGDPAMICMAGSTRAWLAGMTPMYLLMAAVHARPWLGLITQDIEHRRMKR